MPTKAEIVEELEATKRQLATAKGQITKLNNREPEVEEVSGTSLDVTRVMTRAQVLRLVSEVLPKGAEMPAGLTGDFEIKFECAGEKVTATIPEFEVTLERVNNREQARLRAAQRQGV